LRIEREALDLDRFERLAAEGASALTAGQPESAAQLLAEALRLWRGPALADVVDDGVLRAEAARLDELRLVALERRIEADLACGRHADVVGELQALAAEWPLRERPCALLILALYQSGRQADALAAYRAARTTLVEELGIEPGAVLQELERAILRHDPALATPTGSTQPRAEPAQRTILVAALELDAIDPLLALAEPLARQSPPSELVLAATVTDAGTLTRTASMLSERREALLARGVAVRAAAFTSVTPGADLARLATEQEAALLLVDAPDRLLEDSRLLTLLEDAPCDVAVLIGGASGGSAVIVPFAGAIHDWSAVELGAWFSQGTGAPLQLAGAAVGADGRDASRLLANASLAVQRVLGVDAEPLLVEPAPEALTVATRDASLVVVGLTDRWRREGIGRTRAALAASPHHPTLLVRRGLRPGGLAPRSSDTRFTWTIGAGGL
jgi:transcriptional activator